ncbi:MAG: HD domain-containing protein [Eubacterium sp.]|nr:HD domain-containing protein [Eubacterium sp.]
MDTKKLAQATTFAIIAHEGDYRKGTKIPYSAHPIEAGIITMSLTDDEDVIIAAFLHDVVEDTPYTLMDIEERFGTRVAQFVACESEDKMRHMSAAQSWDLRKQATIDHLKEASREEKIICLADKLSNIRQSVKSYARKGDAMWEVFNQRDIKRQEWYYRSIGEALSEFHETQAYQEYMQAVDYVFGNES